MKLVILALFCIVLITSCFSKIPKKQTAKEYKELADDYYSKSKYKKAIKSLQMASELDRKDPDIYVSMAEYSAFYLKQTFDNKRKIQSMYNKAMDIINWYEPALLSRANFYYNICDYKNSIDNLDSLLKRYPTNSEGYLLKARIYYGKKDTTTGNEVYRQTLRHVPPKDIHRVYNEKAFQENRLHLYKQAAADYLQELKITDGVKFTSYCALSWAYYNIGKVDSACYYYELWDKQWYSKGGADTDILDKACKK
jgi:tetratricopeptide (TPR) repeat protein